jgi:hypothetical protein
MGCCLFALLLAGAPRMAFLLWWLVQPVRMQTTFDTWFLPLVGVILAPWTTIMYVAVFPGGVVGFDWVLVGLGVAVDIGTYVGNARARQQQTASKKAIPAKSAAPMQPAAPVSAPPATPVAPVEPQAPVEPSAPVEPQAPAAPAEPEAPTEPEAPAE